MTKGKTAGLQLALRRAAQSLLQVTLGGLCGVGLTWVVTASWAPGGALVKRAGHGIEALSGQYPAVTVGLLMGVILTLVWQSNRK